jgi:hypothetical protein
MGEEDGEWGDPDYQRELDDGEIEQLERPHHIQSAVRHITEGRARDRWFADAARLDDDDEQPQTPEPVHPSHEEAGEAPMIVPPRDDHAEPAPPEPSTHSARTAHDETERPIAEPAPTHPAAVQPSATTVAASPDTHQPPPPGAPAAPPSAITTPNRKQRRGKAASSAGANAPLADRVMLARACAPG